MAGADPLAKGTLRFKQHGVAIELATAEGLFSTATIDPGTRFLLRRLAEPDLAGVGSVADIGCGYGPLGLWLAAASPGRTLLAIDRDALAVEVTAANAVRNGVGPRVRSAGGLGYDDLGDERFDLVVSNIPAKVGPAALRHLVLDAGRHLHDDGLLAVVVVDRLAAAADELLAAAEVVDRRTTKGYVVFVAQVLDPGPSAGSAFDAGAYGRGRRTFGAAALAWEATTSFAIAEFDTLSHGTQAAIPILQAAPLPGPVGVVGVGQGHLPLVVARSGARVVLVDRDLLALRTAATNVGDGVEVRHRARPDVAGCAAAVVALGEKEPVAVTAELLAGVVDQLPEGAPLVLHGRAVDVGRVLDLLGRKQRRAVRELARHGVGAHTAVRVVVHARRPR